MSREIKFRAFKDGAMSDMGGFIGCSLDYWLSGWAKDFPVMQYTGLKDKNGVEIYEGDVVSFMFLKTKVERKRGVVVFDVGELCYFIRTSSEWGYNHNLAWCDNEVIGNIYENPELLEAINE